MSLPTGFRHCLIQGRITHEASVFHLVLGLSCCLLGWMPGIQAAQGNLFTILGAFTKDIGLDT